MVRLDQISERIISFKWLILLLTAVITIFMGFKISHLTINADVLSSLPDDDKNALLLKQIGKGFGGNRMGIVILETEDIYRPEVIDHIRSLTKSIEQIDGISSVSSLTNIINIKGSDMGIEIGSLIDEFNPPKSENDFKQLKLTIAANEMYKGAIVSDDDTSTLVVFTLSDDAHVNQVAQQVIDKTQELKLPEKLYYIGSPMLITYISELMKNDLSLLLPLAILVIGLVLFFSFRSVKGVIIPLLIAIISIVWTLGTMALFNYSMSMISNNIPIILLAVGSAYAIHVINRVNIAQASGDNKVLSRALSYVMIPVLLAALTTSVGFVSFIFGAYLEMIVDFGIFTALGTFYACCLSLLFAPSMLGVLSTKNRRPEQYDNQNQWISKHLLKPIKRLIFNHPITLLVVWGILVIASSISLVFIERSVDIQAYFKKGNPTRRAESIMVEKFGGTKPIFVHFKGNMQDPEVLSTMMATSLYMEKSKDVNTSMSIAKLIAEINKAISGKREVPQDMAMIEQLWFLLEGNEILQRFVNEELTEGIIISKFKSPDNKSKIAFANYMQTFIREHSTEDCQIQITGMPFVDITMDRSLINSQLASISLAIVFMILIVGLAMRSITSGYYAATPIISAILILFGIMGATGISLNIATVLVASVALGIGIDYSIHVISHFNKVFDKTQNIKQSIEETLMISGKAILINVVSVSAGFLVLVFSDMVPLQYFGILIAVSMLSSSLGALTLLPVMLLIKNRRSKPKSDL